MRFTRFAWAAPALLAALLPCLAADAPAGKRDDSASEKLNMRLSLQCWTFNRLTFFETVDRTAALGVKYLEMFPGQKLKPGSNVTIHHDMSDETIAEIKKKLAEAGGLKVIAYGVDGVPTDEAERGKILSGPRKWASRSSSPRRRLTTFTINFVGNLDPLRAAQPSAELAAGQGAGGLRRPHQADRRLLRCGALDAGEVYSRGTAQEAGRAHRTSALQGPQRVRPGCARCGMGHGQGRPEGPTRGTEAAELQGFSVD